MYSPRTFPGSDRRAATARYTSLERRGVEDRIQRMEAATTPPRGPIMPLLDALDRDLVLASSELEDVRERSPRELASLR